MGDAKASRAAGGRSVLQLGDPGLRGSSEPVADLRDEHLQADVLALHATLAAFRREHGFGRAVAAPQIGVNRRFIALNLDAKPFTVYNPAIVWRSAETFTMWDDCMSFPGLLVKVERSKSVSVRYTNDCGEEIVKPRLELPVSELFQHEIDHLDGILAVDRAHGTEALVCREVFEAKRDYFAGQVDYLIQPTPTRST